MQPLFFVVIRSYLMKPPIKNSKQIVILQFQLPH